MSASQEDDDDDVIIIEPPLELDPLPLATLCGLSPSSYVTLCSLEAPPALFNILCALHSRFGGGTSLRCLDVFSGVGHIKRTFVQRGLPSIAYDRAHDATNEDILTSEGFCTLLQYCRQCIPGQSITHWGLLCSTWIYMSRNSTGRRLYNVEGKKSRGSTPARVRQSNIMASRVALALMYLVASNIIWILENPSSSLVFYYKRMVGLDACVRLWKCRTWLGAFGGPTRKNVCLWSNNPMVYNLMRRLSYSTFTSRATTFQEDFFGWVQPTPHLALSQEYPVEYAEQVYESFVNSNFSNGAPTTRRTHAQTSDLWDDADLKSICDFLKVPHDRLLA